MEWPLPLYGHSLCHQHHWKTDPPSAEDIAGLPVHRLIDGGSNLKRTTSWPESQHWSVAPHGFRYLMLALLVVLKLPDNHRITSQAIPTPWGTAICSIGEFYFMTQFVAPSGDTSTSVTTKCCTTEYFYSHHIGPTC